MQVEQLVGWARDTPTDVLLEALGGDRSAVKALKSGKRPMTVKEVGALAEANGKTLADILAV